MALPSNTKPFISSVVAAHNEEIHLSKCIDSLLNQTYQSHEIIIVENGNSSDKTFAIAKSYASRYPHKIRAFSLKGKQRGPGNAWNFGTRVAKGSLIHIVGADLRYSKKYLAKGASFLMKSKEYGLVHSVEVCDNASNWWARAFFLKRNSEYKPGRSRVFSLIKRKFLLKRPFNSGLGYADDQTIFLTKGIDFPTFSLTVTHTNPASFQDTWGHSRWVGRSITYPQLIIFIFPLFPLYAIYKTLKHLSVDFFLPFLFFLPFYYSIRYFAYFYESVKKIIFGKKI